MKPLSTAFWSYVVLPMVSYSSIDGDVGHAGADGRRFLRLNIVFKNKNNVYLGNKFNGLSRI